VTPRTSLYYRTEEECEKQLAISRPGLMVTDRCTLQPPIPLGWVEWEASIEFKAQVPGEPGGQEIFSVITQTFTDCRKVSQGLVESVEKARPPVPPGSTVNVSRRFCKPVYIANRNDYTPLQVSGFEGVLVRGKVAKK